MITRRNVVLGLPTAGAAATLAGSSALAAPERGNALFDAPSGASSCRLVLEPASEMAQAVVDAYLGALQGAQPTVQWNARPASSWNPDDIQMHTRYLPFPDGAALPEALLPDAATPGSHESYWGDRPNAVAVEVHTHAVLIDKSKAMRRGLTTSTLGAFASKGVRPYFYVAKMGPAPDNCWLYPVVTQHLTQHRADPSGRHLVDGLAAGTRKLAQLVQTQLDTASGYGAMPQAEYDSLIDKSSDRVAMHGNPALLARRLSQLSSRRRLDDFDVVSFQDFTGIRAPSVFASSYLQVGRNVVGDNAAAVLCALTLAPVQEALSVGFEVHERHVASLDACNARLCGAGTSSKFRDDPLLVQLLDHGLLSEVMIDIDSATAYNKAHPSHSIDVAEHAANRLRYKLALSAFEQHLQAAAASAAPEIRFA